MFSFAVLVIISISLLVLSALVLFKNYKSKINIYFVGLSISSAAWFVVSYYEDTVSLDLASLLVKLDLALAALMATFIFLLFLNFPAKKQGQFKDYFMFLFLLPILLLDGLGLLVTDIAKNNLGNGIVYNTSPLYYLYIVYIAVFIFAAFFILFRRLVKSRGQQRAQIQYVLLGGSISATIILVIDGILPRFFDLSSFITRIGIYSSLFFIGSMSYAIVRHKLLDIRMVVARSVTYATLLLILAGFYAGIMVSAQSYIFPETNYSVGYISLQIVLAIIMAFSFQPLRRWITKATDKIFFKNAYDKDDLLSELSHTLGSTIVLIEMLYKISDIMTREMKASRTLFALIKDENRLYTVQANGYQKTPEVDPRDVQHITKDGIMVADELPDNSAHKRMLRGYDAAIAIPLKTEKEIVGVLLLGEKSSGDMYSQQDLAVLEIIAPEIAVAIENAKSYEEINRFNVTLRQEVKHATTRLKLKNQQLMELDKAKDEFISMASHQLRTPLTAIKGYLSMLLEGDAGDIKVSQYDFINEAYSGANRMVGLINDLLNVSRMETGRFFLEPKELDVERVVNEEVKQLTNAAKAKGLYLKIEKKGKVPHIWADETKIRQVIMNFMDNAIYYTNTGGVTIVLRHDKNDFIYEVRDTGIGVPRAQVEHLFEKFFRADNARTARPDGTGLGIYLAKRVVEDHGGEIIFDSVEGKGSMFGFRFPLKKKVVATQASAPEPKLAPPAIEMPTATEIAEKHPSE